MGDAAMPSRILLEVCIASVEDAVTAQTAGAHRLELNAALGLGGLTPSLGTLVEVKQAVTLPVFVMLRPRPGGFCYSRAEFRVIQRDLDLVLQHGADGLVAGVLTSDGHIDEPRCRLLREQAGNVSLVFHRAFDVLPDPLQGLEQLIDLGFQRILTSGQAESAAGGAPLLAELIRRAAGRIEILPAGGINWSTVFDVLRRTGCDQVHASLRHTVFDNSTAAQSQITFGSRMNPPEDRFDATSPNAVADLIQSLQSLTSPP
jgi:copper homeostasis protein